MTLSFTVFGEAIPQGSAKAFMPKNARYPIVTSDNPRLKGWRQRVAEDASIALEQLGAKGWYDGVGPITVVAMFHLPRPKTFPKKGKPHLTRPDVDKLARAIGDALTGVLWRDDSQVTRMTVGKCYAAANTSPRAEIEISAGEDCVEATIASVVDLQHPLFVELR